MLAWLALSAVRKVFRSVPGARKDFWGGAPPGPWNLQSLLTDFVAGACAASKLSGESTQPDPSVQGPPVGCGWGIEPQVSCAGGGGHLTRYLVPTVPCRGPSRGFSCQGGPEQSPLNPPLKAPTLSFRSLGIPWAPAGQAEGEEGGVSVGMSVAVLACWRPISQMIFATIKKCGGVKWQFHIQRGERGVHLGTGVAAAGGGGKNLSLSSQLPWLTPLPKFTPHTDIHQLLRLLAAAVSSEGLRSALCVLGWTWPGKFPFCPSP